MERLFSLGLEDLESGERYQIAPMQSRLRAATKLWSIGGKPKPASDQGGMGKVFY